MDDSSDTAQGFVVALCGRRRTGKDTIANHLLSGDGGERWCHVKIAQALKTCVSYLFDITLEELEGDDKDKVIEREGCVARGVTPRRVMQWFGTEVMQHALMTDILPHVGRLFWVDRAVADIKRLVACGHNVVISDVRFPHELDALTRAFGDGEGDGKLLTLYIEREYRGGLRDADADAHESEVNVDQLKARAITIVNTDGDIPGLLQKCESLIQLHASQLHASQLHAT
jgi:hypothetical protein